MIPAKDGLLPEKRVLILAPTGKDAQLATGVLASVGISTEAANPKGLPQAIAAGAGALILTEEALESESESVVSALQCQPAWSDLPVVLLTYGGANSRAAARAMELFGNVILLERPVRVNTLVTAVRTALRARRKQYQIRDHMEYRQRMNEELELKVAERTRALTDINKDLESFCYSVAHDLRTPLRSINSFAHLLKLRLDARAEKLNDEEKDYFQRIGAASSRMGRLIDDLLNLSRLARRELKQEEVDLSALAASIADELRNAHPQRNVRVKIAPGLRALGDPDLLRLVLQNLFENAWKFTGRTPRAAVEFGLDAKDGPACFVRDNGVGFDMAYAGQLFGVFQRLHSENEFPGNGIGLATVRRIVEKHGGRAWAESKPGHGAVFYFTLPTLAAAGKREASREAALHGR